MLHRRNLLLASLVAPWLSGDCLQANEKPWRELFDGTSLTGWKAIPRLPANPALMRSTTPLRKDQISAAVHQWHQAQGTPPKTLHHVGDWRVEEGAIVGGQKPSGSKMGAYLITEDEFGDFELEYEMRPDWRTDTGVLVRQHEIGSIGLQILCDHRPHGGIGGVYANSLGNYLAAPFEIDGDAGENFTVSNLRQGQSDTRFARAQMQDAATLEQFLQVWKLNDWNQFRVRCVGTPPVLTIWINGLKIGTLDSGNPGVPGYDTSVVTQRLGTRGHIGLEVHNNGPKDTDDRWAPGAVSRWRNIRIREIQQ